MYPCATCVEVFSDLDDCNEHMDEEDHWADCETCDRLFRTVRAADQHMKDKNHYQNYCAQCDRVFNDDNSLRMHLNSRIHRGKTIECPFCGDTFVTASASANHVESGTCPNALHMDRESLLHLLQSRDPSGLITNPHTPRRDIKYRVSECAFNDRRWECALCHKEFRTSDSLVQHLGSRTHQQKDYHCPNTTGCEREFVSLAALFSHLESESCDYMCFERVQQVYGRFSGVLTGHKIITSSCL